MVIHIVDIQCLALYVPKNDAPVRPNSHSPIAFQLTLEGMEAEAGQIHIRDRGGRIKPRKNIAQSFGVLASNPAAVVVLVALRFGGAPLALPPHILQHSPFWRVVALAGEDLEVLIGRFDFQLAEFSVLRRV